MNQPTKKKNIRIQISKLVIFTCFLSLIISSCGSEPEKIQETYIPTIVYIEYPSYDRHFRENQLPLKMKATALANGEDISDQIRWTSDKDGDIGVGSEITVNLSRGIHMIKAFADDGITPGENEIPVTIDAPLKRTNVAPPKDRIAKVYDRDDALFIVNRTKQVITDTSTGLMWDRMPDKIQYTYAQAIYYAKQSELGGYTDWRLPTIDESVDIHNLYYDGRIAILQDEFCTFSGNFWTQTTADIKSGNFKYIIEQIDATYGLRQNFLSKKGIAKTNSNNYVRLVRNAR